MIDSFSFLDKFLQDYRFRKARPFLHGDVLDFGGNRGELKKYVGGKYLAVNNDYSVMDNAHFDTITCLAVIEHINPPEVLKIFYKFKNILNKNGRICLTTPTKMAKPVLELLALAGIIDKANIMEHKHYWNKKEIYALAKETGLVIKKYKKFQLGFNQLVIMGHK